MVTLEIFQYSQSNHETRLRVPLPKILFWGGPKNKPRILFWVARPKTKTITEPGESWGLCIDDDTMVLRDILPGSPAAHSEAIRLCVGKVLRQVNSRTAYFADDLQRLGQGSSVTLHFARSHVGDVGRTDQQRQGAYDEQCSVPQSEYMAIIS